METIGAGDPRLATLTRSSAQRKRVVATNVAKSCMIIEFGRREVGDGGVVSEERFQ